MSSHRRDRPPMRRVAPLGSVLGQFFAQKGMSSQMEKYRLWQLWDKTVGPQIAANARPLRFREGVLEVSVGNPVWMQQLQLLKNHIRDKLNQVLGGETVTEIFLRRGTVEPRPPQSRPPRAKLPELTPAELKLIQGDLADIRDPELRSAMERLRVRQLQEKKRGRS